MIAIMKFLLQIPNYHCADCGDAPKVQGGDEHVYIGYFENPHGEQWVFTYDRRTKTGVLRGGDMGWENVCTLSDDGDTGDLLLGVEEKQWLRACWTAAKAPELSIGAPHPRSKP